MKFTKTHINYPLVLGGMIVTILLIIMMVGPQIVPLDPYAMNFYEVIYENGQMIETKPQMPPNDVFIWGTDTLGRDLFSQVIYGTRITLTVGLLIALGRFLVALPFAYFAGFGGNISGKVIDFFNRAFSALPALLISFIILSFPVFSRLDLTPSIFAFTLVLTFVGWGRLANVLKQRIKDILSQDFIQGEIAIGKSKFLIAIQNVLPHLTASIIINFFLEVSRALILIAGLGIFSVYVGVNKIPADDITKLGIDFKPNYHPEWGGILASSRYALMVGKPWMAIYPALAFFVAILGFNLLGEGFKIEVNKRTSRVITNIRKIPFHLSPRTFIHEIKDFRKNKLPVLIKSSAITLLIIIIVLSNITPKSLYEIDKTQLLDHLQELSKEKYEGRMTGTKGRDEAASYITQELKKYGVEPYFENGYIEEIQSDSSLVQVKSSTLSLYNDNGQKEKTFNYVDDYTLSNIHTQKVMFYSDTITGNILTHEEYRQGKYDPDKKYFLILDPEVVRNFPDYMHRNFFSSLSHQSYIVGVIYPRRGIDKFDRKFTLIQGVKVQYNDLPAPIFIEVSQNLVQELVNNKDMKIVLENDINLLENYSVKNIGGIIKGKNSEGKDKILIVTNYDYFGIDSYLEYKGLIYNGTSVATVLEMVEALCSLKEKPENDIVFMFFDGSKNNWGSGAKMHINSDYRAFRGTYAFCMNDLGIKDSDVLYMDTSYAKTNQKEYYEYAKYIRMRADQLDIKLEQGQLINGREHLSYIMNGKGRGILFKTVSDPYHKYYGTIQDDISLIDIDKLKDQAQLILDTVIHSAYDIKK